MRYARISDMTIYVTIDPHQTGPAAPVGRQGDDPQRSFPVQPERTAGASPPNDVSPPDLSHRSGAGPATEGIPGEPGSPPGGIARARTYSRYYKQAVKVPRYLADIQDEHENDE
jgi:hypothetical protein